MTVEIICADVREGLARFPDGHFHCCVTSPPFWGLRDYGLEPTVWGDDGCEHEWIDDSVKVERGAGNWTQAENGPGLASGKPQTRFRGDLVAARANTEYASATRGHCRRCNAWRGTLGLEPTPELYVEHLVSVMREVRRVLRDDGTLWLDLGDSYAGSWGNYHPHSPPVKHGQRLKETARWNRPAYESQEFLPPTAKASYRRDRRPREDDPHKSAPGLKPKDLVGVPWRVAFALQADGWWLRSDIVWSKPNPMPESVRDRPTRSHEYLFLLTKRERYAYDQDAIREAPISTGLPTAESLRGEGWHDHSRDLKEGQRFDGGSTHRKAVPTAGRNRRSVWEIATQPFGLEMCGSCKAIYEPAQYRRLRGGSNPRCNHEVVEDEPCGGTTWLPHDGGAMCAACETFYTAKQLAGLPRAAQCRRCGSEEWLSHFAVFPEKLVEPCILAGSSEWGCCPECAAPWERVVEKATEPHPNRWSKQADAKQFNQDDGDYGEAGSLGVAHTSTTTGWRPTCKHGAEPVPCRILDPFSGSGTVGVVAERLGQHSVLIDAKEEYCEMARHRTAQRGLMVEAAL